MVMDLHGSEIYEIYMSFVFLVADPMIRALATASAGDCHRLPATVLTNTAFVLSGPKFPDLSSTTPLGAESCLP